MTSNESSTPLLEAIQDAKINPMGLSLALCGGVFDAITAAALLDLLSEDREWVVSLSGGIAVQDQETEAVLRDAFACKISKMYLDSIGLGTQILSTILHPSSFDNLKHTTSLFLSNCSLSLNDAQLMKGFFTHATSLESLFFTSFTYLDGSMAEFFDIIFDQGEGVMVDHPIQIGLYRNELNQGKSQGVVDVLGRRVNVEQLILSHNPIQRFPNFESLQSTKSLSLGSMRIPPGSFSGSQFVESVRGCVSLLEISLGNTILAATDIAAIFAWLELPDTSLERLSLRNTSLSEESLKIIESYMKSNSSMRSLELIQNVLPESICREFARTLCNTNDTMEDLRVANLYTMHDHDSVQYEIEAYNVRNWAGRRLLKQFDTNPIGLWPHVLARIMDHERPGVPQFFAKTSKRDIYTVDSMYHMLRGGILC